MKKMTLIALAIGIITVIVFSNEISLAWSNLADHRTDVVMNRTEAYWDEDNSPSSEISAGMPSPTNKSNLAFFKRDGWTRILVIPLKGRNWPKVTFYQTPEDNNTNSPYWGYEIDWSGYTGPINETKVIRQARHEVMMSTNIMTKGLFWFLPFN